MSRALVCLFCVWLCAGARAAAQLTGGAFSVPALTALSGGGQAAGGSFSVSSANLGGPSYSSSNPAGGIFIVFPGAAAAVLIIETAKSDLGAAHCSPVPYRPAEGHTKITFTALTRQAVVRIYTVSGELVRTLEKSDGGETLDWDVRNSRGQMVASGVYLFTVRSGSSKATGKLMIIW